MLQQFRVYDWNHQIDLDLSCEVLQLEVLKGVIVEEELWQLKGSIQERFSDIPFPRKGEVTFGRNGKSVPYFDKTVFPIRLSLFLFRTS